MAFLRRAINIAKYSYDTHTKEDKNGNQYLELKIDYYF